jgi:hypothetical protein
LRQRDIVLSILKLMLADFYGLLSFCVLRECVRFLGLFMLPLCAFHAPSALLQFFRHDVWVFRCVVGSERKFAWVGSNLGRKKDSSGVFLGKDEEEERRSGLKSFETK